MALPLSFCSTNKGKVEIKKVEHFYIASNKAKVIFQIFSDQFGLPVVWDYQSWGSFSSGGITLGNVVLECIGSQPDQAETYYGVALEPNLPLKRTVSVLDSVEIAHGRISKAADWSTLSLNNLLPDYINLFLCDYHDRQLVNQGRKKAMDELVRNNGGPLGIQYLKEIVIGSETPQQFERELTKIPGVVRDGNTFLFQEGPSLTLVKSDMPFLGLSIKVTSVNNAKLELETLGFGAKVTEQGLELADDPFAVKITLSK